MDEDYYKVEDEPTLNLLDSLEKLGIVKIIWLPHFYGAYVYFLDIS